MRAVAISDQSEGINLLRSKGGASPNALFELLNGWVTPKRTIAARPGSVRHLTFPAGTVGAVGFENVFHTFTSDPSVVSTDPNVVVHILRSQAATPTPLVKIYRAFPFIGRLYVVTGWADGVARHFWIESPAKWLANRTYAYKSKIVATTDNGFYYVAETKPGGTAWQANTVVAVGDIKHPTVYNGFKYELTAAAGATPYRTSNTEPTWPKSHGATVTERRYITTPTQTLPGGSDPDDPTPDTTGTGGTARDEYGPYPSVKEK